MADEASLTCRPLTSCRAVWFLTGRGLVPGLGVGDPCCRVSGPSGTLQSVQNHRGFELQGGDTPAPAGLTNKEGHYLP